LVKSQVIVLFWFLISVLLDVFILKRVTGVTSLDSKIVCEERELSMTVDLEPVCADKMLLVKHGVIGTQEVEILKLIF